MTLDETHDPALRSFVASANAPDGDFPIQNLPYAVFRRRGDNAAPRVGVAIGAEILDVAAVATLMDGVAAGAAAACASPHLNALMECGPHGLGCPADGSVAAAAQQRRPTRGGREALDADR
jgi:fumarylacetoacetase